MRTSSFDLVKASLKRERKSSAGPGYTNDGATPNLAVLRTMRVSMSRRFALRRPTDADIDRLEVEIAALRAKAAPELADELRIRGLCADIEQLKRRQRAVPFIDPIDVLIGSRRQAFRRPRRSCSA